MDLIGVVFPRRCPICDGVLKFNKEKICDNCKNKITIIKEPRCMKCSKPLDNEVSEYCYDCQNKKHNFISGIALMEHNGLVAKSLYKIKYNNKREYIDYYVEEFCKYHSKEVKSWNVQVLIPIPLHFLRKRKRGYNQAELIAKKLGKELGIPYCNSLLKRSKNTKPQKELNDKDRKKNLKNAFFVPKDKIKNLPESVILVDDIYTTGATIDECSKVLLKAGCKEIYFITLTIGNGY